MITIFGEVLFQMFAYAVEVVLFGLTVRLGITQRPKKINLWGLNPEEQHEALAAQSRQTFKMNAVGVVGISACVVWALYAFPSADMNSFIFMGIAELLGGMVLYYLFVVALDDFTGKGWDVGISFMGGILAAGFIALASAFYAPNPGLNVLDASTHQVQKAMQAILMGSVQALVFSIPLLSVRLGTRLPLRRSFLFWGGAGCITGLGYQLALFVSSLA